MHRLRQYDILLSSLAVFYIGIVVLFPHYQYYIDPDGTSYLTISRRYAEGDLSRAVNGYWSPLSCWLTAGLARVGMSLVAASVFVNSIAGVLWLIIFDNFLNYFKINKIIKSVLLFTLIVFLFFAVFWQTFDDLWECAFLLMSLRIMLMPQYSENVKLWLLNGLVGALAYFAKAYAFPFFLLNTTCCSYIIAQGKRSQWVMSLVFVFSAFFAVSAPWIILLHEKYNIWTTSTAGNLNMSWYLVGHPEWKQGIIHLIPPVYPDSPYYWEDPYIANGDMPHFWNSLQLAGMQILRLGQNVLKFIVSISQLSVFLFVIIVYFIKKIKNNNDFLRNVTGEWVLITSILIFPLGYALINFESRYLWFLLLPGLSLLAQTLQENTWKKYCSVPVGLMLISVSCLVYPAYGLMKMYHEGKKEFELGMEIKRAGINGSFTSNAHPRIAGRLAYFSDANYCYNIDLTRKKTAESDSTMFDAMISDAARLGVQYYFRYTDSADDGYRNFALPQNGVFSLSGIRLNRIKTMQGLEVWQIIHE